MDQQFSNVLHALSEDQVVRLTGLSKAQLRYWDKTGFFKPRHGSEGRRASYSRVYSFRDLVGLKTLAVLRKEHGVSLQHLRKVAENLSHLGDDIWSNATLYVLNKEVYFDEPDTGHTRGVLNRQYAVVPLMRVAKTLSLEVDKLKERPSDSVGKVERHRFVAHNQWTVAGTRIPTGAIRRFRDAGHSVDAILGEYPSLTRKDVEAALEHEEELAKSA